MVSLTQAQGLAGSGWRAEQDGPPARRTSRPASTPGAYEVATAIIPGADPRLASQEIVLSCHLDHQRPGANDNASGCATILEVARTLAKLIARGELARAAPRTIRFVWPPEVEGHDGAAQRAAGARARGSRR